MKKQGLVLASVAVVTAAIGAFCFLASGNSRRKKQFSIDLSDIHINEVDGVIKLKDIVAWLKTLNLQTGKDTPFIIDGKRVKEVFSNAPDLSNVVLVGTYDELNNKVGNYKALRGQAFDKDLHDVLSHATNDNPIVVLI